MKITSLSELPSQPVSHDAHLFKKVMVENGQVPHLTNFSQVIIKPGEAVSSHSHKDMYEVFFVSSGSAELIVNGATVNISANMSITIEPTEEHSLVNTGNEDLVMTYFGIGA